MGLAPAAGSVSTFHADQPAFALTMERYLECRPRSSALRGLVVCFYEILTPDHEVHAVPIVPDASVDLLWIDNGAAIDAFVTVPAASLAGLHSRAARRVLGARLVPGAISRLMKIAVGRVGAHQVALNDLVATTMPDEDRIHALTFTQFVVEIEHWLVGALRAGEGRPVPTRQALMHHCVGRVLETGGGITVHALASETGFSTRYINQAMHLYTGLSPSRLGQVSRAQRLIATLSHGRARTLAAASQLSGYYDQSHMNRSLRSLLQVTATQLGSPDFFRPHRQGELGTTFRF